MSEHSTGLSHAFGVYRCGAVHKVVVVTAVEADKGNRYIGDVKEVELHVRVVRVRATTFVEGIIEVTKGIEAAVVVGPCNLKEPKFSPRPTHSVVRLEHCLRDLTGAAGCHGERGQAALELAGVDVVVARNENDAVLVAIDKGVSETVQEVCGLRILSFQGVAGVAAVASDTVHDVTADDDYIWGTNRWTGDGVPVAIGLKGIQQRSICEKVRGVSVEIGYV